MTTTPQSALVAAAQQAVHALIDAEEQLDTYPNERLLGRPARIKSARIDLERALRAALSSLSAQPEAQQPVAWLWEYIGPGTYPARGYTIARTEEEYSGEHAESWRRVGPLYAALRAALAQPEAQQPVLWVEPLECALKDARDKEMIRAHDHETPTLCVPLYAAPPASPPVYDRSVVARLATQMGWTPPASPPGSGRPPRVWPKAREVQRDGDMAPPGDTQLRVMFDTDNDVLVTVVERGRYGGDRLSVATVEFCNGMGGGGKSPRTREALIALMVAMEQDAAPTPPQREEGGR